MRSKKDGGKSPADRPIGKTERRSDRQVGDALRAVYQNAVSENIPDEMLDLLSKLG